MSNKPNLLTIRLLLDHIPKRWQIKYPHLMKCEIIVFVSLVDHLLNFTLLILVKINELMLLRVNRASRIV